MKSYELLVRVHAANLLTVIEVLKDAAEIVQMKQADLPVTPEKHPRKASAVPKIARERGKRADQVILELMSPGVSYCVEDIGHAIVARGFSASSAHPAISMLVKDKKVERHQPGYCRLIQAT